MNTSSQIVQRQRAFFRNRETRSVEQRIRRLSSLRTSIEKNRPAILAALVKDLHKGEFEAHLSEIGFVLEEIDWFVKRLPKLTKPRRVPSPIYLWPSKSHILPEPLGTCLVISPWNYPFQLSMVPLIAAVAAGNTVLLKPSERSPATSDIVTRIVEEVFPPEYVATFVAGPEASNELLGLPFDKIFFTGSKRVGRIVYEAAAKQMIPVTLELGGKNPCIVLEDADLKTAAERITWGKFFNAGQTCVAPNYLAVHEAVKDELLEEMRGCIEAFYGSSPTKSDDFGRLIDADHARKATSLLDAAQHTIDGVDIDDAYIPPTLVDNVTWDSPLMADEIFAPILPVLTYRDIDALLENIVDNDDAPLAVYVFSDNLEKANQIYSSLRFGGGCINDTVLQAGSPHIPFGGVGGSGLGAYHGDFGFNAFTHFKSRVTTPRFPAVRLRFPPYTLRNLKLLLRIIK